MKRKLLIVAMLVVLALSLFVISVSAEEMATTYYLVDDSSEETGDNILNVKDLYYQSEENKGFFANLKDGDNVVIELSEDISYEPTEGTFGNVPTTSNALRIAVSATVTVKFNGYSWWFTRVNGSYTGFVLAHPSAALNLVGNEDNDNIRDMTNEEGYYTTGGKKSEEVGDIDIYNDYTLVYADAGSLSISNLSIVTKEEVLYTRSAIFSNAQLNVEFKNCSMYSGNNRVIGCKDRGNNYGMKITIDGGYYESFYLANIIDTHIKNASITGKTTSTYSIWIDSYQGVNVADFVVENSTIAYDIWSEGDSNVFKFYDTTLGTIYLQGDSSGGADAEFTNVTYSGVDFGTKKKDGTLTVYTRNDCLVAGTKTVITNTGSAPDEQYPIDNPALGHGFDANDITNIEYKNGYMSAGLCTSNCVRCDVAGIIEEESSASPLFSSLGYSKPENGTVGVAVSFKVNKDAIEIYKGVTSKSLEYGAVAAAYDNLGDKTLLDDNGNINTLEKGGVIKAPVSQANVTSLTLKITGFTKEEHKDVKLVLGAYVIVTEADATTVSYLQVTKPAEGYSYITYNEISA